MRILAIFASLCFIFPLSLQSEAQTKDAASKRRNVIIFVADGLRRGPVNAEDAPTLLAVRSRGVDFRNSFSVFPTFKTANASTIATGHELGDTGDFSNTIWPGFAVFDTGNFDLPAGTPTPFIENDQILADLNDHFQGNYLGEETLLDVAHQNEYNTAAIGKVGPTGIQHVSYLGAVKGASRRHHLPSLSTMQPEHPLGRLSTQSYSRDCASRNWRPTLQPAATDLERHRSSTMDTVGRHQNRELFLPIICSSSGWQTLRQKRFFQSLRRKESPLLLSSGRAIQTLLSTTRATAWAHSIPASMARVRERPSKTLIITCDKSWTGLMHILR